jgi:hypothetical protein
VVTAYEAARCPFATLRRLPAGRFAALRVLRESAPYEVGTVLRIARTINTEEDPLPRHMALVAPQPWLYRLTWLFCKLTGFTPRQTRQAVRSRFQARSWLSQFPTPTSFPYKQKTPLL